MQRQSQHNFSLFFSICVIFLLLLITDSVVAEERVHDADLRYELFGQSVLAHEQQAAVGHALKLEIPHYLGSMSCASTNCHGSYKVEAPDWKRAYLMWTRNDPHARAREVLYSELSLEMGRKLQLKEVPGESKTCLVCHGYPTESHAEVNDFAGLEKSIAMADASLHSLGVSCEACHGPASQWIEPHRSHNWKYGFSESQNAS
jgi:hypothetical protein